MTCPPDDSQPGVDFDALPDSAFVRANDLVRCARNRNAILPFSAPTLWRLVRQGNFPKPQRFSEKVTCWKVADIRDYLAGKK